MEIGAILWLLLTVVIAFAVALTVTAFSIHRFRKEQARIQKRILNAVTESDRDADGLFLTGHDAALHGELVAQFKVNHGKQVVSLLESDGKRFLHVDGKLSAPERAKMVRYLKSEGFMS